MTSVDDALNTSAPEFAPLVVTVDWAELPPGVSPAPSLFTTPDSLRNFGGQQGGNGWQVTQSLDDGLPDPVTMTGSNDASGTFGMDLAGRPPNIADVLPGWRSNTQSGFATGTSVAVTLPTGIIQGDYVIVAITVNNAALPRVYDAGHVEGDPWGWSLLSTTTDGALVTWVFGIAWYTALAGTAFTIDASSPHSWVSAAMGVGATANDSSQVPIKPEQAFGLAESVSQTAHTTPAAALTGRGWVVGVFATTAASGPWVASAGAPQIVQNSSGTAALQLVSMPMTTIDDSTWQVVSNTTGATALATMQTIPLKVMDRPRQDAMAYFSPFNKDSPIKDFERDTAAVSVAFSVVAPDGLFGTNLFKGQMADITLTGRTAELSAISRTRLLLDQSITLPTVSGYRECCTSDWLASYILARGGQYMGIAASPQTRWWAPLHGSVHAHMDGPVGYGRADYYTTARTPLGPWGLKPPSRVEGPFTTAIYAQQTNARTEMLTWIADRALPKEVPGQVGEFNDLLSQKNSVGRLTFWVRGDALQASPASLAGTGVTDSAFVFTMITNWTDVNSNFVKFEIRSDRDPQIYMENAVQLTGSPLPSDGAWHFVAVAWNYATGVIQARMDGSSWNVSSMTSSTKPLVASEALLYAKGRYVTIQVQSKLPTAEIQVEAGPTLLTDGFGRFYPTPTSPSRNVTFRPARSWIEAVAEPTPVQGWSTLQDIAQSTLTSMRINEEDNVEFVPLDYFGESAQMTVSTINVLDTDINASDLGVLSDPSKTRNAVTLEYQDTRIDINRSSVLDISSPITIPKGTTQITFPLDIPAAEIHGAASPFGSQWAPQLLTALQIAGTNPLQNENVMSVNSLEDGQGTVYTGTQFSARITTWDSASVTLVFTNKTLYTQYLSNNGSGIPFLRILGYPIRSTTSYESSRDTGSTNVRRERPLSSQMRWIHRREEAVEIATTLVTALSRPRTQLSVTVMADPRRRPGQLVSIADSQGTQADGTWRILSIAHKGNGAMYVQDLQLVRVGVVGVWDQGLWDNVVWGV